MHLINTLTHVCDAVFTQLNSCTKSLSLGHAFVLVGRAYVYVTPDLAGCACAITCSALT